MEIGNPRVTVRPFRFLDQFQLPVPNVQRYYCPEHPMMQALDRACLDDDLHRFKTFFYAWRAQSPLHSPPLGPPGYPLGTVEPTFYLAIREHRTELVAFLLSEGVRVCRLAISEAIEHKCSSTMWQAFEEHGHFDFRRPLDTTTLPPLASVFDNVPLVKWFLEQGVSPNTATSQGMTTMLKAVCSAPFPIIRILCAAGGDISLALPFAVSPYPPGHESRSLQIIRYLLDCGADPDARKWDHNPGMYYRDNDWGSALNNALALKRRDVVEELLRRGARVDRRTLNQLSQGETARELATTFIPEVLPQIELCYKVQKWKRVVSHVVENTLQR
ncbi:hypothetical protein GGR57DRAFT_517212 [Xylariaceae sp. FL1272]|nr:hypothetical protein GGR57DRAFT_517212 [Xylariaceae sp. FL1272]